MNRQPNRIPTSATNKFAGSEIDRGRPLSFRLNGRIIHGFAGDTVLSAVLAAGIDGVGMRDGEPIGLSERFAPAVVPAATGNDPAAAMPMERVPALPGLDLVTLGGLRDRLTAGAALARLRNWLRAPPNSLDLRIDDPGMVAGAWRELQPRISLETDTVVVGGGIAGMSAAVAAATAGDSVILIERTPALGGNARYFGAVENEEPPDASIRRLSAQLSQLENVAVFTRTEAFSLAGTCVRAHQIDVRDGRVAPSSLSVRARRVVLATGALEVRPAFPGNRSPGVDGATAAFRLASRYGVWMGRRALFCTTNNFGYRLALIAKDAGVQVLRIADTRLDTQSRFVDFVKASGITMASGLAPRAAVPEKRGAAGLAVSFAVAIEGIRQETAPIQTDRFVVAGAWQPDLSLWLTARGATGWDARAHWLQARGTLEHVALAGSAAGYRNASACMLSGETAIAVLHGRAVQQIDDRQIDALYESPDGVPPAGPQSVAGKCRAYLGTGFGFAARDAVPSRRAAAETAAAQHQALELDEITASVQVGELPAEEAGAVAGERCLGPALIADTGWRLPPVAATTGAAPAVPGYLAGRFGPKPQLWVVGTADARLFETGCLIFSNSDETDPAKALGVIVDASPMRRTGGVALLARSAADARFFARDGGGPVPIQLQERLRPDL